MLTDDLDVPTVVDAPPPKWTSDSQIQINNAQPERFRSPVGLGTFALLGIAYLGFSFVFSVYTSLRYRSVIGELIDGSFAGSFDDAIDIENAYAFSGVLDLLGILVIAVTWLFWMRRLRSNVVALGRVPAYRPAWIFWGWVTPILNYFRPFQLLRDFWQKSDPNLGPGTRDDPPRFYLWWWVGYVVSGRISAAIVSSVQDADTLEQIQSMVNRLLVLDFIELPGLILAVLVVRSLTARQVEAGARLGRGLVDSAEGL